jgi:hypothetical protein
MGWQPIGTMPRDGSPVLVYINFMDTDPQPGVVVGCWMEDGRGFNIKGPGDSGHWHVKGAWAWMPLPEPPSFADSLNSK